MRSRLILPLTCALGSAKASRPSPPDLLPAATLGKIVDDYIEHRRPGIRAERHRFRRLESLEAAVHVARAEAPL